MAATRATPTVYLHPGEKLELRVPRAMLKEEPQRVAMAGLFARLALAAAGMVLWPTVRWVEGEKSCSVFCDLAPLPEGPAVS
jgi:hypothetical protein